ncbi:MAG: hypothetical protein HN368_20800, partial [Spirochaetales bacterium]|nr:hypothetical protein [Spirochaetales bacterium]
MKLRFIFGLLLVSLVTASMVFSDEYGDSLPPDVSYLADEVVVFVTEAVSNRNQQPSLVAVRGVSLDDSV